MNQDNNQNLGTENQIPDLDSIEELSYKPTPEEDKKIDANVKELQDMGFGQIVNEHDLIQLFWELARQGRLCDKLMRIAIIECIAEDSLYLKVLGMAKHYNWWTNQKREDVAKAVREENKAFVEVQKQMADVRKELKETRKALEQMKKENHDLRKQADPKAVENEIRSKLKKEFWQEWNLKYRYERRTFKSLLYGLMNHCGPLFRRYDFQNEVDVDEYIGWYRMMNRKITKDTIKDIKKRYIDEDLIRYFLEHAKAYNAEWQTAQQEVPGPEADEDSDLDVEECLMKSLGILRKRVPESKNLGSF